MQNYFLLDDKQCVVPSRTLFGNYLHVNYCKKQEKHTKSFEITGATLFDVWKERLNPKIMYYMYINTKVSITN